MNHDQVQEICDAFNSYSYTLSVEDRDISLTVIPHLTKNDEFPEGVPVTINKGDFVQLDGEYSFGFGGRPMKIVPAHEFGQYWQPDKTYRTNG
jgi:hypothetical protein